MIAPLSHLPKQFLLLMAGLALYACVGSPTPDNIGVFEILIGIGLFLSLRPDFILTQPAALLPLIYGLILPGIGGVVSGNHPADMMRDIVPLFFFFLPLFWASHVREHPCLFYMMLTGIGFIFAVRALWAYGDTLLYPARWLGGTPADLLYLANSPEVLMTALFGLCVFFRAALGRGDVKWGFSALLLIPLPLLSMALMLQRAGLGLMALVIMGGIVVVMVKRPYRALGIILVGSLIALAMVSLWTGIAEGLMLKNRAVGENGRVQEWGMVWRIVTENWTTLLFGMGWGFRFENPAVAGLPVTYTHSLMSFLLLKTGIVGLAVIGGGIITGVLRPLWKKRPDIWWLIPLILPLFIAVCLYASYKSLGFGLILCAFWGNPLRKLEKTSPAVA